MYNINQMLKAIDELQNKIDSEIKDDKKAVEVWEHITELEQKLLDIKEAQRL